MKFRREAITALTEAIYSFAESNEWRFPSSLSDLVLSNGLTNVVLSNYYYRQPSPHDPRSAMQVSTKNFVVAEREESFPSKPVFFIGLEGNLVVLRARDDYERLLMQGGITNFPR